LSLSSRHGIFEGVNQLADFGTKKWLMKKLLIFLLPAILLCGCVSDTRWQVNSTQRKLLDVEPGMTRAEVVKILGTPRSIEVVPTSDGSVEFLFYQTRFAGDAMYVANDKDLTPFAFVDNKLVGWSRNFYDTTVHNEITIHQTFEDKTK
jgi:hypothetical protein